ncbi:amino acid ABC transporter ATP-binding protein [Natronocalculus amylovorans]|uniref:Phosphate ABC transporter ATP-binding protein n=1 Tax=Natronocalculus amylovorans TaxID=2917812 RepID=A0AAE3FUP7_9EURY|nr:phosphate ABC transporter ATP-binding protein [Natronocalculus amylovorans]MCL9815551.1 phosphate ABC transporter ATP-binding protein [Natronocalculus amylovorans]
MALRVENVARRFGETTVFEAVSVTIERGEILALIGPSGAGKSTLLRTLGLFERPEAGTVRVDQTDIWAATERERLTKRRSVGMVFQEPNLFGTTVRRNVEYGLRVRRSWRTRFRDLVPVIGNRTPPQPVVNALSLVGMEDAIETPVESLSGGEAQRVAFARAMAYDPTYLLFDEPTSDLDPRNTAVIEDAVITATRGEIGAVVATHDMHQAQRIADRVALLLDGEVVEIGPTEQLFSSPQDPRTQKFIDGELVY